MHLFEELVITEVVDEHHRPVPAGTFGAKVLDPEALATRLRSALTARGAVAPAVRIQTVDAIPLHPFGKAPLVVGRTTLIPPWGL